jgi:1-acyl-sn-glycerol-3-phosphate acyltransferase
MKNLTWRLINGLQLTYFTLWTAFWITVAVALATVTRRRSVALWLARRIWAPGINYVAGIRLEVVGTERVVPGTAYYFASNHQSFMDIPVLFQALPADLNFVAKAELTSFPFIGWFMASMGMVFVERGHRGRGLEAIEQVSNLLSSGHSVLSFSEGTRGDGVTLGRFKSGGFAAPLATGSAVVPVAIFGTASIMPARRLSIRPGPVTVRIGSPLPTTDLPPEGRHAVATDAQSAVSGMLAENTPTSTK